MPEDSGEYENINSYKIKQKLKKKTPLAEEKRQRRRKSQPGKRKELFSGSWKFKMKGGGGQPVGLTQFISSSFGCSHTHFNIFVCLFAFWTAERNSLCVASFLRKFVSLWNKSCFFNFRPLSTTWRETTFKTCDQVSSTRVSSHWEVHWWLRLQKTLFFLMRKSF